MVLSSATSSYLSERTPEQLISHNPVQGELIANFIGAFPPLICGGVDKVVRPRKLPNNKVLHGYTNKLTGQVKTYSHLTHWHVSSDDDVIWKRFIVVDCDYNKLNREISNPLMQWKADGLPTPYCVVLNPVSGNVQLWYLIRDPVFFTKNSSESAQTRFKLISKALSAVSTAGDPNCSNYLVRNPLNQFLHETVWFGETYSLNELAKNDRVAAVLDGLYSDLYRNAKTVIKASGEMQRAAESPLIEGNRTNGIRARMNLHGNDLIKEYYHKDNREGFRKEMQALADKFNSECSPPLKRGEVRSLVNGRVSYFFKNHDPSLASSSKPKRRQRDAGKFAAGCSLKDKQTYSAVTTHKQNASRTLDKLLKAVKAMQADNKNVTKKGLAAHSKCSIITVRKYWDQLGI